MKFQYTTTYDPAIEQYRQFLFGELRRMEEDAQRQLTVTIVKVEQVRRELLERQQPLLDELTRIYEIHAQPNLILAQ